MKNSIWIAYVDSEEYGQIWLTDYAGVSENEVRTKIYNRAYKEGYRGDAQERVDELGYKIVEVNLKISQNISEGDNG